MNRRMVFYIIGQIIKSQALLLMLPASVGAYYGEECVTDFLATAVIAAGVGFFCTRRRPENRVIYAREGFVVVALSWVLMSLIGALPFFFSREIPSFVDCLFETASGFSTTGASILTDVERMSRGLLFWRSFTHWVGGMGVLVFVMAVVPLGGSRSMHLMRAEVPGPIVGKLVPKLKDTAKILYGIYILLTAVEILLLVLGGMPLFDSAVHAFGTAGTGGFSMKNASIAAYNSPYIEWVVGVFMVLFGINFNLYFFILLRNFKAAAKSQELRLYLGLIAASVAAVTWNIRPLYHSAGVSVRNAFFQVASIITTTGYATADFNLWPELSRTILVLLMFCGACAGSTGGGLKTARLLLLFRMAKREIRRMLHPRSINVVEFDGKPVGEETLTGVSVFFAVYIAIYCAMVLLISFDGFDFATTMTAAAACLNNIGPGLGMVGPAGNYAAFSAGSKLVLSAGMLLGRLEVFPLIVALAPSVWRGR